MPLPDITQKHVQQYFERRLYGEDSQNTETVRREKTTVRYALKLAKRYPFTYDTIAMDELLHVFHVTDLPKVIRPDRHILTPDEWHRIYDAIGKRRGKHEQLWRSLVTVAKDTGLRRGELLKIEWRDINGVIGKHDKGTLNVRAEITKTNKSRLLPLTWMAGEMLIEYYYTLPDEYVTPGSKVFGPSTKKRGKRCLWGLTESGFEQAWVRLMEDAEIKVSTTDGNFRNFAFHEIRHNAETNFRRRKGYGLSGEEADYMMGHVTKGMRAVYDHSNTVFAEEIVEAIRDKLEAADDAFYKAYGFPLEQVAQIRRRPEGLPDVKPRPLGGLWPWEDGAWYGEWEEKHGRVVQKRRRKEEA
jgi:integrase